MSKDNEQGNQGKTPEPPVLKIHGDFTSPAAARGLMDQVAALVSAGWPTIQIDMEEVHNIDTYGMSALLAAHYYLTANDGELKLANLDLSGMEFLEGAVPLPLAEIPDGLASLSQYTARKKQRHNRKAQHCATPAAGERTGPRISLSLLFQVRWSNPNGTISVEEVLTEVVNESGARIRLQAPVNPGLEVEIANLYNRQNARARVVWVGPYDSHAGNAVGIKFLSPNATRWLAEFAA
jgi:ABC-type transporter Mla MlaB component